MTNKTEVSKNVIQGIQMTYQTKICFCLLRFSQASIVIIIIIFFFCIGVGDYTPMFVKLHFFEIHMTLLNT